MARLFDVRFYTLAVLLTSTLSHGSDEKPFDFKGISFGVKIGELFSLPAQNAQCKASEKYRDMVTCSGAAKTLAGQDVGRPQYKFYKGELVQVTLISVGQVTASKISAALDIKYSEYKAQCVVDYGDLESVQCWSMGGVEIEHGTQVGIFGEERHFINYRLIDVVGFEQEWNYSIEIDDF